MSALDYAVLGVLGISIAWGLWHGLVREVVSLAGWVVAFLAANLLAGPVGERLPKSLASPEWRVLLAFLAIFLLSLGATTLAGLLLAKLLKAAGLGGLDRALGALFGLARGALIAVAFALVAGLTSLPRSPIWSASASGALLADAALLVKPWLPPALAERLRYH
jgi:membrane protein required for colicin V production